MKAPESVAFLSTFLFLNFCLWATFTNTKTRGWAISLYTTKEQVFQILGVGESMGLSLTDTYMINPGESICGLIFANTPEKYFNV